ncbi:hypothetical protein [Streptomyces griseorubiginosus]|uniref:hypothetical protein n=1 Tax=Streptomyces griseorubiginosus TaxID=67304 RepID=UPI003686F72F
MTSLFEDPLLWILLVAVVSAVFAGMRVPGRPAEPVDHTGSRFRRPVESISVLCGGRRDRGVGA